MGVALPAAATNGPVSMSSTVRSIPSFSHWHTIFSEPVGGNGDNQ